MSRRTVVLLIIAAAAWGMITPVLAKDGPGSSCVSCHTKLDDNLGQPVKDWAKSIHQEKGVSCHDCHGGNPKVATEDAMAGSAGFIGVPRPRQIPALCAQCHANPQKMRQYNLRTDQYALYKISIHGQRLLIKGDEKVATCVSCHGNHDIKSPGNPESRVYRANLPATCSQCHSDKKLMDQYNLPSDQFAEYKQSYHGTLLLEKGDTRAANCADCHGTHGATPPGVNEVANVCGNCHGQTEEYFNQSSHKKSVAERGIPRCIDCHGNHKILYPDIGMFAGTGPGHCGSCHGPASKGYKTSQLFYNLLSSFEARVKSTQRELSGLKATGIDLPLLEEQANEINAKIVETAPIAHALKAALIREKIGEGEALLTQVQNSMLKIKTEAANRKKIFLFVIAGILTIVYLLYLKIISLPKG